MNKFLKRVGCILMGLLLCVGLSACDGKAMLQSIVSKTYTVTVQLEQYVTALDSSNLVSQVRMVETPLKVTSSSLRFVADRVSDSGTKASIINVATTIDNVVAAIQTVDAAQVEDLRAQILSSVAKTKEALVLVASQLDIDLNSIKARAGVTFADLMLSTSELEASLKSLK